MNKTTVAWGLIALGVIMAGVSLGADVLGLGSQPGIIGWKQWLGAVAGVVTLVLGAWSLRSTGQGENVVPED